MFKNGRGFPCPYDKRWVTVAHSRCLHNLLLGGWQGRPGWRYLFGGKTLPIYQAMYLGCTILGAIASLGNVIDFSDMMILSCAFPNIIGAIDVILVWVKKPSIESSDDVKCGQVNFYCTRKAKYGVNEA